MYSQVQVPIPIHGDTIECVVKIKFFFVILLDDFGKNYFMDNNAQTTEIGTCITYLTGSDTIKKCWYWPDTDTDTRNRCSPSGNYLKLTRFKFIVLK